MKNLFILALVFVAGCSTFNGVVENLNNEAYENKFANKKISSNILDTEEGEDVKKIREKYNPLLGKSETEVIKILGLPSNKEWNKNLNQNIFRYKTDGNMLKCIFKNGLLKKWEYFIPTV